MPHGSGRCAPLGVPAGLRTALAAAGALLGVAAAVTPAAAAASSPAAASSADVSPGAVPPAVIGGAQLAGHGVIVDYPPSGSVPRLPGVKASAFVIADAGTGQALRMPAFLRYDQTITAKFPVSARKSVTLYNQNSLLTSYRGALGGKIGWTTAAGATYVGMARRNGVTLIVALLHCPALTEIDAAKSLLDWGFAADGTVRPVGTLAGPARPAAPAQAPPAGNQQALRAHSVASGPSVLATAGFSCVALLAAGLGFAYSRRQRSGRQRPGR